MFSRGGYKIAGRLDTVAMSPSMSQSAVGYGATGIQWPGRAMNMYGSAGTMIDGGGGRQLNSACVQLNLDDARATLGNVLTRSYREENDGHRTVVVRRGMGASRALP